MDPLWSETCWSTFQYFIIWIVSTCYILCIGWIIKCLIIIDVPCKHKEDCFVWKFPGFAPLSFLLERHASEYESGTLVIWCWLAKIEWHAEKVSPSATFSTKNLTCIDLGLNRIYLVRNSRREVEWDGSNVEGKDKRKRKSDRKFKYPVRTAQ
jgi:hypothetical protein